MDPLARAAEARSGVIAAGIGVAREVAEVGCGARHGCERAARGHAGIARELGFDRSLRGGHGGGRRGARASGGRGGGGCSAGIFGGFRGAQGVDGEGEIVFGALQIGEDLIDIRGRSGGRLLIGGFGLGRVRRGGGLGAGAGGRCRGGLFARYGAACEREEGGDRKGNPEGAGETRTFTHSLASLPSLTPFPAHPCEVWGSGAERLPPRAAL